MSLNTLELSRWDLVQNNIRQKVLKKTITFGTGAIAT
jgi:hypothetical protein